MEKFGFKKTVESDDHSVRGVVVYDEDGNEYVAYYSKNKVELIKIDHYSHDWEIVNNCTVCKGTGKMKYQDISPVTHYQWVPWEEKKCTYCES